MAHATQDHTPSQPAPPAKSSERITAPLIDMEEDLARFNSVLDYLETHGDDDSFGVVSMMRPFATSISNRLEDLRTAVHS